MRLTTRKDHEKCIAEVVARIVQTLDEPLNLKALAEEAGYSPFHFHRIFHGMLGETIGDLQRRLRLERAALRLRNSNERVTSIALDAGYGTHEAFIKAFRGAFGCSPSEFRKRSSYSGSLPALNSVHYPDVYVRFVAYGGQAMNIEIRQAPKRRALCLLHKGPYHLIGETFGKFFAWAQSTGAPVGDAIGLYYCDPSTTPPDELRSHAGALVPDDFATDEPGFEVVEVPEGVYAVGTHVGPYDGLMAAWSEFYGRAIPEKGLQLAHGVPFELYVKDWEVEGPEKAVTEIWAQVEA